MKSRICGETLRFTHAVRKYSIIKAMKSASSYTAIIEKDVATGLYVAYIPDLPGAHTQGETLEELNKNLKEVVALVLEDDNDQKPESYFVGTQLVAV